MGADETAAPALTAREVASRSHTRANAGWLGLLMMGHVVMRGLRGLSPHRGVVDATVETAADAPRVAAHHRVTATHVRHAAQVPVTHGISKRGVPGSTLRQRYSNSAKPICTLDHEDRPSWDPWGHAWGPPSCPRHACRAGRSLRACHAGPCRHRRLRLRACRGGPWRPCPYVDRLRAGRPAARPSWSCRGSSRLFSDLQPWHTFESFTEETVKANGRAERPTRNAITSPHAARWAWARTAGATWASRTPLRTRADARAGVRGNACPHVGAVAHFVVLAPGATDISCRGVSPRRLLLGLRWWLATIAQIGLPQISSWKIDGVRERETCWREQANYRSHCN